MHRPRPAIRSARTPAWIADSPPSPGRMPERLSACSTGRPTARMAVAGLGGSGQRRPAGPPAGEDAVRGHRAPEPTRLGGLEGLEGVVAPAKLLDRPDERAGALE